MITMVTRGGYLWEVMKGPAPDTYLKIALVMCWMSIILHGVNIDRSVKKSGRRLRFWPQMFLTLISLATPTSFIRCLPPDIHVNSLVPVRMH